MNGSGKFVKEMIAPHVQRQFFKISCFGHCHSPGPPQPRCAWFAPLASTVTAFILHQFWSSKRNDKTQAASLMVISQTKRANSWFLLPSPRPPSSPSLGVPLCQKGHFRVFCTNQGICSPDSLWFLPSVPPFPVLQGREKHLPVGQLRSWQWPHCCLSGKEGELGASTARHAWGVGGGKGWKKAAISDNVCHLGACLTLISRWNNKNLPLTQFIICLHLRILKIEQTNHNTWCPQWFLFPNCTDNLLD